MNRRTFLKNSCLSCLGLSAAVSSLQSCAGARHISATLTDKGLLVPLQAFIAKQGKGWLRYVVVRNESLQYPVCIYRNAADHFTALYMRCSHQGAELQVAGERLSCPAHGSEFDVSGQVQQGPADQPLRSFPVTVKEQELFIDLRKPV